MNASTLAALDEPVVAYDVDDERAARSASAPPSHGAVLVDLPRGGACGINHPPSGHGWRAGRQGPAHRRAS